MPKNMVIEIETDVDRAFLEESGIDDDIRCSIEAPKNYKDPDKIEAYVAEKFVREMESAGKNPLLGRLTRVLVQPWEGEGAHHFDCEDEALLVHDLAQWFRNEGSAVRLIGWNLRRKVLPFLAVKVAQYGIQWPTTVSLSSRDWKNVVDLAADLSLEGRPFEHWCRRFRVASGDGDAVDRVAAMTELSKRFKLALPWKFSEAERESWS